MTADERFTVDTSVVAKLYLDDEEFAENAVKLFQRYSEGSTDLVAPFLVYYELPNAVLWAAHQRRLDVSRAREAIDAFFALDLLTIGGGEATTKAMIREAADLAVEHRCSIYDAVFLAVADALDAPLITADARFLNSIEGSRHRVLWIGDYEPAGDSA